VVLSPYQERYSWHQKTFPWTQEVLNCYLLLSATNHTIIFPRQSKREKRSANYSPLGAGGHPPTIGTAARRPTSEDHLSTSALLKRPAQAAGSSATCGSFAQSAEGGRLPPPPLRHTTAPLLWIKTLDVSAC